MLRLTGGEFRGRGIETPKDLRTRPTQAKLRQALFNSLQFSIPEAKVLDLFAGSGSLGFEAISRGASHVTFVELAVAAVKLIDRNAATLGVTDRVEILSEDVGNAVPRILRSAPFDIVLADPPYSADWELKLLNMLPWENLLVPGGYFALEWGNQKSKVDSLPEKLPFLVKVREKNYGDSVLTTYQRETS